MPLMPSLPPVPAVIRLAPPPVVATVTRDDDDDRHECRGRWKCPREVPAPLPVFGVAAAWAVARQIRGRIREGR